MADKPLLSVPTSYDDLIEGQPSKEGPYPGFDERLCLAPGWPNEFGVHKFFRVVGFSQTLDKSQSLSLRFLTLKTYWSGYHKSMLEMAPVTWKDRYFRSNFAEDLKSAQVHEAARMYLQLFDRAALCILFLHAVLETKRIPFPLYRYVRLRPVTFYVEGFDRVFPSIVGEAAVLEALQNKTDQSLKVFEKMADGGWFVTRKTAELTLRALRELASGGVIEPMLLAGMAVRCGRTKKRSGGKNIWPVVEENVRYFVDEYLSPEAWRAVPAAQRPGIKVPPA